VNELLAILANRGRALGLAVTAVIGSDDRTVRLTVPGRVDDATLAGLVSPGDLRIRTVTSEVTDTTGTPRSGTGPDANGTAGSGTGPDAEPVTLGTVKAKLGSAYQVAAAIQDPSQVDAGTLERLAPFGALSPAEVAVLPATMQYAVPLVGCAQLDARPPVASGASGQPAAACGGGRMKYLLGPAEVGGTDVRAADAVADPIAGWGVDLQFTGVGSGRWTALTQHAVNGDAVTGGSHAIAFVVDGRVVSAPVVQEVIVGDALISGQLSRAGARLLAAELRYGPLPAFLRILSVSRH
jgi:preprotein translocase subunit SecD